MKENKGFDQQKTSNRLERRAHFQRGVDALRDAQPYSHRYLGEADLTLGDFITIVKIDKKGDLATQPEAVQEKRKKLKTLQKELKGFEYMGTKSISGAIATLEGYIRELDKEQK